MTLTLSSRWVSPKERRKKEIRRENERVLSVMLRKTNEKAANTDRYRYRQIVYSSSESSY
jgi:hypothetical protein